MRWCPGVIGRPNSKCPFCMGEVPWELLRSKSFPCPTCEAPLRVKGPSTPFMALLLACGYWLTYVTAERMGLEGNVLFMFTLLLGGAGGLVLGMVVGSIHGRLLGFGLEPDPIIIEGGGILNLDSKPKDRSK
jgi:hypothetical protein